MKANIKWHGDKITAFVEKKGESTLKRFARFVRVSARSMIRKARLKKRSDLTKEQEAAYQKKLRIYKRGGLKNKPVRGWQSSDPGEPPRWRPNPRYGGKSPLRNQIIYHYDDASQTATIGPEGWRTADGSIGVGTLEKGGTRYRRTRRGARVAIKSKPRPFMRKAMKLNLHILRSLK